MTDPHQITAEQNLRIIALCEVSKHQSAKPFTPDEVVNAAETFLKFLSQDRPSAPAALREAA